MVPSSTSMAIAIPVNCFETEATSKTVSGVTGTLCSRLAIPYPFFSNTWPLLTTSTAAPGEFSLSMSLNRASTRRVRVSVRHGVPTPKDSPAKQVSTKTNTAPNDALSVNTALSMKIKLLSFGENPTETPIMSGRIIYTRVAITLLGGITLGSCSAQKNESPGSSIERLDRSEEHTSELQSLMRISYAV